MPLPVILFIDPAPQLPTWQSTLVAETCQMKHAADLPSATRLLRLQACQAVVVSTHFHAQKLLQLMELVKTASQVSLIPWIWAIDTSKRMVQFPITSWADKLGFLYPQLSQSEWRALLARLINQSHK